MALDTIFVSGGRCRNAGVDVGPLVTFAFATTAPDGSGHSSIDARGNRLGMRDDTGAEQQHRYHPDSYGLDISMPSSESPVKSNQLNSLVISTKEQDRI